MYFPGRHDWHDVAAQAMLYVPTGQRRHPLDELWPGIEEYLPGGHLWQAEAEVAPDVVRNFPVGQLTQMDVVELVELEELRYVPAEHWAWATGVRQATSKVAANSTTCMVVPSSGFLIFGKFYWLNAASGEN